MKKNLLNKKALSPIEVSIGLLLMLAIVFAVGYFLFNANLPDIFKNIIPEFSSDEEHELIDYSDLTDEEVKDICPNIVGKIKFSDGKYFIYIDNERTNLIWKGDDKEAFIKVLGGKKIADIEEGVINLDSEFFNDNNELNLDSDLYQNIRFKIEMDKQNFVKLNNAFYGGMNLLCKENIENVEIDYGFPKESIFLEMESLNLQKVKNNGLKINFEPYITLPEESKIKFFYVLNKKNYMEIKGAVEGFFAVDISGLGKIYPDGSVWIDHDNLIKERANLLEAPTETAVINNIYEKIRKDYSPFVETNLRVNYTEIKNFFENE